MVLFIWTTHDLAGLASPAVRHRTGADPHLVLIRSQGKTPNFQNKPSCPVQTQKFKLLCLKYISWNSYQILPKTSIQLPLRFWLSYCSRTLSVVSAHISSINQPYLKLNSSLLLQLKCGLAASSWQAELFLDVVFTFLIHVLSWTSLVPSKECSAGHSLPLLNCHGIKVYSGVAFTFMQQSGPLRKELWGGLWFLLEFLIIKIHSSISTLRHSSASTIAVRLSAAETLRDPDSCHLSSQWPTCVVKICDTALQCHKS